MLRFIRDNFVVLATIKTSIVVVSFRITTRRASILVNCLRVDIYVY